MNQLNNIDDDSEQVTEIIDTVQNMPEEKREEVMVSLEMHYGPIPHPDILKEYENLYHGAAKSIIENGVAESQHRRNLENKQMEKMTNSEKRGQWLGFIIGVIIILVGAVLIMYDHVITGTCLSGFTALSLVGLFVGNAKEESKDTHNDD